DRLCATITEDDADEQARQRFQNFTGWNFGSRMAGTRRSRRRLSPDRALRLGRRDLQPFLDAGPGRAAQIADEEARSSLYRGNRVQPGESLDGWRPRRKVRG